MITNMFTRALALSLLAPAAMLLPGVSTARSQGLCTLPTSSLQSHVDPSLASMRAGRVEAPSTLATQTRSELRAAQQQSPALAALRAGFEPTHEQWTWILIGAGVALLIILL